MGKKVRKNLSFLLVFLIFALLTISVGNIKSINDVEAIDNQSQILSSSPEFIWDRSWGGNESDIAYATWGNGTDLYTTGATESFGEGAWDLLIIKWDTDGNQIWNRTWGGIETEGGYAIWGNGAYIYTSGFTNSFEEEGDLLIIKWDTDGNQIWNRTWGGSNYECATSIWGNGTNLYTTGYTQSFGAGARDLFIIKWDTDGNEIWNRTWGGVESEFGFAIKGKEDYIYTSGSTNSFGEGGTDLLIIKWDTDGNQIWNQTWGDNEDQQSNSLWCDNYYFYISGTAGDFFEGEIEPILIKFDYDGNQIWNRTYTSSKNIYASSIWSDGTYIYNSGTIAITGSDETQLILMIWETDGTFVTDSTWGSDEYSTGLSIWGDDSYIYICGSIDYQDGNSHELLFTKINHFSLSAPVLSNITPNPDLDGNITINWDDIEGATSYNIYRDTSNIDDLTNLVAIDTTTSTSYTDYGLFNGTYYYIIVAARDSLHSPISNCESLQVEISPEPGDIENKIPGYPFELTISILGIFIISLSFRKYRELV